MRHFATGGFWSAYRKLPAAVRRLADGKFELLKSSPDHPSLRLKRIGRQWWVRVGLSYRALGVDADGDIVWFWIGTHAEHDQLLKRW